MPSPHPSPSDALAHACRVAGCSTAVFDRDEFGSLRRGGRSLPRYAVWAWLREHHGYSYPEIGRMTNTPHMTVRDGVGRFWARAGSYPQDIG